MSEDEEPNYIEKHLIKAKYNDYSWLEKIMNKAGSLAFQAVKNYAKTSLILETYENYFVRMLMFAGLATLGVLLIFWNPTILLWTFVGACIVFLLLSNPTIVTKGFKAIRERLKHNKEQKIVRRRHLVEREV